MTTTETRYQNVGAPELRSVEGSEPPHICGYASVFNKLSRKLPGGFVERVDTRAFAASAQQGYPEVIARFDHRADALLGTTAGGTLHLATDDSGLAYDVLPPVSAAYVIELMQRGDVKSSSFAFRNVPDGDDWEMGPAGLPMRTLLSVELVDVAPVVQPAYPSASAFVRSMGGGAVESLALKFSADPEEIRSMMTTGKLSKLFKITTPKGSTRPDDGILAKYRQLKQIELNGKRDMHVDEETRSEEFDTSTRAGRIRALEYLNSRRTDTVEDWTGSVKHLGGNDEEPSKGYTGILISTQTAQQITEKAWKHGK